MFGLALVFLFLIRLRFPRGKSVADILISRYGRRTLQFYRRVEKASFRIKKLKLDLQFLITCYDCEIIPNFIRFKPEDGVVLRNVANVNKDVWINTGVPVPHTSAIP